MTILEDLTATGGEYSPARKPRVQHPTGWEPGINTETGRICVRSDDKPDEVAIDWTEWLAHFGFDSEHFTVLDDTVEVRSWDSNMGGGNIATFYYYKAKIVKKALRILDADLIKEIRSHKPLKRIAPIGEWSYIIALADLQIGKKDGDGLKGLVERTLLSFDHLISDIRLARKEGYEIGQVVLAGLGDIIEGCDGHYSMQTFSVELDRREQVTVARRLLLRLVRDLSKEVDKLLITTVPGNHGEHRKDGKAFTSFGDNDDLAVFDQLADMLRENKERYGNVTFMVPKNDLTVTIDIDGTILGFAHGHQARNSGRDGLSHTKIWTWWTKQAHAKTAIGDADILVTGHFHYYTAIQNGARTHFQAPPLDSTSEWYENTNGYATNPGVLTFLVNGEGWKRQRIL